MGTQANVQVKFAPGENLWFYQHYDGYDILNEIALGLKQGAGRWEDPGYLARCIFSAMMSYHCRNADDAKRVLDAETGFGITPFDDVGECEFNYVVDIPSQVVSRVRGNIIVEEHTFSGLIK